MALQHLNIPTLTTSLDEDFGDGLKKLVEAPCTPDVSNIPRTKGIRKNPLQTARCFMENRDKKSVSMESYSRRE